MKAFHFLILFALILFSACENSSQRPEKVDVHSLLESMPEQDRDLLDAFFRILCQNNVFAYTLFGNKPMSVANYFSKIDRWSLYNPSESLILDKGWDLWTAYSSRLPSRKFVLTKKTNYDGLVEITIINKKKALETISNNLDTFHIYLNSQMTPQEILDKICRSETVELNSILYGILLGFGKENALHFERKGNLIDSLNAKRTPPYSANNDIQSLSPHALFMVEALKDRENDTVLESPNLSQDLNELFENENCFAIYGSDYILDAFWPPTFVYPKDSLETKKLHETYLETKQKITKAYQKGSFLEVTLNQWVDPK